MATIAQILSEKWPEARWSIKEDDYETLRWQSRNIPKPSEEEIRAFSAELDIAFEEDEKSRRREQKLLMKSGNIVKSIEVLALAVKNLASSIKPDALTVPLDLKDLYSLIKRLDDTKDPPGNGNPGGGNPGGGNPGGGNPGGGNPGNSGGNAGGANSPNK